MAEFAIGQVAAEVGLRPSTIRYYEAEGLLPLPQRRSGKRVYDRWILDRLALIELAKECGFSIEEIRTFLHGFTGKTPPRKRWQSLAKAKFEELNTQMVRISRMKRVLRAVLRCGCRSVENCGATARRHRLVVWPVEVAFATLGTSAP
jgi:MerR family redox-sensitive transcriptional activator SoxR